MKMAGKTVLITGSTDGVGRYVAAKLAVAGAKVLIHGRDASRARALEEEIRRAGGCSPSFYQADLSSLAETTTLAHAIRAECKQLDVLVSNAGIGSMNGGQGGR
jgi:NAD(P)-dependent dehydrogenase (short-subunit alcohol dehydrogenase family)